MTSTVDICRWTHPPATSSVTNTAAGTALSAIRVIVAAIGRTGAADVLDDSGREIQHNARSDDAEADQRRARPAVDETEGVQYAQEEEPGTCDQTGGELQRRDPACPPATDLEADRDERRDQQDDAPRGVSQPPACSTARDCRSSRSSLPLQRKKTIVSAIQNTSMPGTHMITPPSC